MAYEYLSYGIELNCMQSVLSWSLVTEKWLNPIIDYKVASLYTCIQPEIFPFKFHFSVELQGS